MINKYNFIIIISLIFILLSGSLFAQNKKLEPVPEVAPRKVVYDEGTKLRLNDVVFELGFYYNRSFVNFPHGITTLGRLGVILSEYHKLGAGISYTSYYPYQFFNSGNVSDVRLMLFYAFRLTTSFFSFNQYLHIGPGFLLVNTDETDLLKQVVQVKENSYYMYVHPELDFEFKLTRFFSLSLSAGYMFNFATLSGKDVANSQLTAGLIWKWSFL